MASILGKCTPANKHNLPAFELPLVNSCLSFFFIEEGKGSNWGLGIGLQVMEEALTTGTVKMQTIKRRTHFESIIQIIYFLGES